MMNKAVEALKEIKKLVKGPYIQTRPGYGLEKEIEEIVDKTLKEVEEKEEEVK